ncbi:MAG: ATPase [Lachnospiraceae bacterium]|nr:ATPase [Lachnospiraceae bacterium]
MKSYLGIEFGSTRIKAVAIGEDFSPLSSGDYVWKSEYKDNVWTYSLDEVWKGLKEALSGVKDKDAVVSMGISAMMHGYLAFDADWNLLVPFRTWQNTITAEASEKLTEEFGFNVPQRWSISHLYQAVLNKEAHIGKIAHITTLAGYVHYMLTGVNALGIGDASGVFPIDSETLDYDANMIKKFDGLIAGCGLPWKVSDVLPAVLPAGAEAGSLTEKGAALLDNMLKPGISFAPCEGDAGTGMTATNAVSAGTGNVSAGTSIFSMVVLDKPLSKVYPEIDMVTTPTGKPVAMVHCNNCTNDSNAWFGILRETVELFGGSVDTGELYTKIYRKSLEGDKDCGGVVSINYMAGEGVTHLDAGRPMVVRKPDSAFNLANFLRANLYSSMATLKIGMDILASENVKIDSLTGHGGLFKTPEVGQSYMAAACKAPVTVMETAGEGGPYGMALLAAYRAEEGSETLEAFLRNRVFAGVKSTTMQPDSADAEGFAKYLENFKAVLTAEKAAVENY